MDVYNQFLGSSVGKGGKAGDGPFILSVRARNSCLVSFSCVVTLGYGIQKQK